MSRHRSKWITAALAAAAAGLWGIAFTAPFGFGRDEVSDCRGLGVAAIVLLGVWVIAGPRIQRVEQWQRTAEKTWAAYQQERAARDSSDLAGLRLPGGRSA